MQQFSHDAPPILNSWKEIATYLGRGVRTAQRWEREHQMPVHRVGRSKRSPVFAMSQEIALWMRTVDAAMLESTVAEQQQDGHSLDILPPKRPTQSIGDVRSPTTRSLERMRATTELTVRQLEKTKYLLEQYQLLRKKRAKASAGFLRGQA